MFKKQSTNTEFSRWAVGSMAVILCAGRCGQEQAPKQLALLAPLRSVQFSSGRKRSAHCGAPAHDRLKAAPDVEQHARAHTHTKDGFGPSNWGLCFDWKIGLAVGCACSGRAGGLWCSARCCMHRRKAGTRGRGRVDPQMRGTFNTFNTILKTYTKREKALGVNERPWRGYPIQQNSAACGLLVRARDRVCAMELMR